MIIILFYITYILFFKCFKIIEYFFDIINIRSGFKSLLNKLKNFFYLLFISDYLVTTTLYLSGLSVIANYNLY